MQQSKFGLPVTATGSTRKNHQNPTTAKRAKSVHSIMLKDVLVWSSGRDVHTSFSRSWWMGGGRQVRRMRTLRVAGSIALSGWDSVAPSIAWWSVISLPDRHNGQDPAWSKLISTWRVLPLLLLLLSMHAGISWGRIGVGESGTEGWTSWHCEILEGMSEGVGRGRGDGLDGYVKWWWFLNVRNQVDLDGDSLLPYSLNLFGIIR